MYNLIYLLVSIRLDSVEKHLRLRFTFSSSFFLFFFRGAFHVFRCEIILFQWVPCTVHGTHKYFIQNFFLNWDL